MDESWTSRRLLVVLVLVGLVSLALHGIALAQGRVPRDHDGFLLMGLHWFFTSHQAQTGSLPAWIPFMTEGTVGHWWFLIQADPVFAALAPLGRAVGFLDPLAFHGVSLLFQELLLAAGTWMLAARFGASFPARCFAMVAALGSAAGWIQPWWNLQQVYLLPLAFALLDRWMDSGRPSDACLTLLLMVVSGLGGMPYGYAFTGFALVLWTAVLALAGRGSLGQGLGKLLRSPGALAAVLASLLALVAIYSALAAHKDSIVSVTPGRGADGRVEFSTFLEYGGPNTVSKWLELAVGISVRRDYSLYLGALALPFLLIGAVRARRGPALPLLVFTLLLLDFSNAGPTAWLSWYLWPPMRFFRHIVLTAPALKPLLAVLAGLGLDACLQAGPDRRYWLRVAALGCLGMTLLNGLLAACIPRLGVDVGTMLVEVFGTFHTDYSNVAEVLLAPLGVVHMIVVAAAATVLLHRASGAAGGTGPRFALLLLALHAIDLFTYRMRILAGCTLALAPAHWEALARPQPFPFAMRRPLVNLTTERGKVFGEAWKTWPGRIPKDPYRVSEYMNWGLDPFLHEDLALSPHRVDNWVEPFDRLIRLICGQPIDDRSTIPSLSRGHVGNRFPVESTLAMTLTGVTADKLELYPGARFHRGPHEVAAALVAGDPARPELHLEGVPDRETVAAAPAAGGGAALAAPAGALTVTRFEGDHLAVDLGPDAPAAARWLLYRDCWHPGWRARVDGRPVPVLRADLAYKAVPLPPGARRVEFEFVAPEYFRGVAAAAAASWALLLALPFVLGAGLRPGPDPDPAGPPNQDDSVTAPPPEST